MADNFFSLDIDEEYTKVVDAKKVGDILEIAALGKIKTEEFFYNGNLEKTIDDQAFQIKKLLETLKITKKNVNVIIPDNLTYSQVVTMPLLNEKELISAIKYQADQFIPMPIEETNIDIEVLEEDQKEKKALLLIVAAPKKIIEKVQKTAELSGLNPRSIENELSSNGRFIFEFKKNILNHYKITQSQGIMIVNFDINSTTLVYFSKEELIIKESHHISIGYLLFLKEIQVNIDTDLKKAADLMKTFSKSNQSAYPIEKIVSPLAKEFTNELKNFISKYNPSIVLFTNKICQFPGLISILKEEMTSPVDLLDIYPLIKQTPLVDAYKNELSIFIPAISANLR